MQIFELLVPKEKHVNVDDQKAKAVSVYQPGENTKTFGKKHINVPRRADSHYICQIFLYQFGPFILARLEIP